MELLCAPCAGHRKRRARPVSGYESGVEVYEKTLFISYWTGRWLRLDVHGRATVHADQGDDATMARIDCMKAQNWRVTSDREITFTAMDRSLVRVRFPDGETRREWTRRINVVSRRRSPTGAAAPALVE